MRLGKRVSAVVLVVVGVVLASGTIFDIYQDVFVQGDPAWTALSENAIPLLFVGVLPYAGWRLYRSDLSDEFAHTLTTRMLAVTVAMLFVSSWVVGIQSIQGKFKPEFIVIQTTTVAAVAGLLVGYNTAQVSQARDDVEREKNRFEALFENSPSATVDLSFPDDDPVIEDTNEAFEALFDVGDEAAIGQRLFEVIPPEGPEAREAMRAHVERGEVYTAETSQFTVEGGKHFQLRLVPYGDARERAYAIYQDVTELKEYQRELETTVKQLETSNEQLQQFAYVASHDLQEPLRMVSSYVDLLANEYEGELDEEADEYIEYAVDGAERMQDMIDDLLEYSRVRTRGQEFTETDPGEVLAATVQDLELRIDETDAEVTHDDEFPIVEADENQLGQLFQNLVKNAIDHAGEDAPEIHVGAEYDDHEGEVVFSVADNGPGIPEDQQERIFEIFEQGGRDDDGTGIGLAVCQRIVNRHGGDIWVESAAGEGATFCFTIPTDATQQSTAPAPQVG